ncbi:hypothetical protein RB601_009128 [Gaeumannomyces tritici]
MAAIFRPHLLLAALLALCLGVLGQSCSSYGVDYSNGGSYYIDGSSNQYFTFISVFQGCSSELVSPVLVSPEGNQYACSAIQVGQSGVQVSSQCGIPFSVMRTGQWRIVVAGNQIAVQRTINLSVGVPERVTITATPTVVIGVTSTPQAVTVISTIVQTQTLILAPATVTSSNCAVGTATVTVYPQGQTVTITSTVTRTSTQGTTTSQYTTTMVTTAVCHYPNKKRDEERRRLEARVAVAATTVTVTQTTYTVTLTSVTTLPPQTRTEALLRITTATITPAPATVCVGVNRPSVTVTVRQGNPIVVTQTNIAYKTITTRGTVYVGRTVFSTSTNQASATACWRAGGWYGL